MVDWKTFEVVGQHISIENKRVRAVYVTSENADEVADHSLPRSEQRACFPPSTDKY